MALEQFLSSFWALPFSGNVDLSNYHPLTDWFSQGAAQMGFINIYAMESDNPDLERGITNDVAGYGMQLSRLVDAVHAISHHMDYSNWDDLEQKRAMENFMRLADEINEYKRVHQSPNLAQASIKDSIDRFVTMLKERDTGFSADSIERFIAVLKERDTGLSAPR